MHIAKAHCADAAGTEARIEVASRVEFRDSELPAIAEGRRAVESGAESEGVTGQEMGVVDAPVRFVWAKS